MITDNTQKNFHGDSVEMAGCVVLCLHQQAGSLVAGQTSFYVQSGYICIQIPGIWLPQVTSALVLCHTIVIITLVEVELTEGF